MSSCVRPVRLTMLSCDSLVVCRQGVLVVLCWAQLQLVSNGGDRQESPSGSIGSSTGRLQRRERPGGRGVLGVARGAGGARGGRGAPSHPRRKRKTVWSLSFFYLRVELPFHFQGNSYTAQYVSICT